MKTKQKSKMTHVTVKLPDDEYERLRLAMKARGVKSVQEAVQEAIRFLVHGYETNNLGSLTRPEAKRVAGLLQYIRDEPDGFLLAAIDKLGDQQDGLAKQIDT